MRFLLTIFVAGLLSGGSCFPGGCSVTTTYSGGRRGDHFFSYLRAKIVSRAFDIPYLYIPAVDLHWIVIDNKMTVSSVKALSTKGTVQIIRSVKPLVDTVFHRSLPLQGRVVYQLTHYADISSLLPFWSLEDDDILHKEEREAFLSHIPTRSAKQSLTNGITVAVHVRRPSGGDLRYKAKVIETAHTAKFISEDEYARYIDTIAGLFPEQKIYARIFTDSVHGERISQSITNKVLSGNVVVELAPRDTEVADLYAMLQCDCLIRPGSAFSAMAEVLGDYKIVIRAVPRRTPKQWIVKDFRLTRERRRVIHILLDLFGLDTDEECEVV